MPTIHSRERQALSIDAPAPNFQLPPALEASEPPEARGVARDDVRLMVSYFDTDRIVHTRFRDVVCFLDPGDVIVINTSGTRPAALNAVRGDGISLVLHLSTRLPAGLWLVELRRPSGGATQPFRQGEAGETLHLPAGGSATLRRPYGAGGRLWVSTLQLSEPLDDYLAAHGSPIRYRYVHEAWPLSYYETVYATEAGSAEMPSAGRPFTTDLITRLVARGVHVVPLLLHTGVASLEAHEAPYEEYYRVPAPTARLVNVARAAGGRVVAVGTTVVRALETVTGEDGRVQPGEGWTNLLITPQRQLHSVNGLLTGFHEPQASHLALLEALAGRCHLRLTYREALAEKYLWHEFGDLHLILP